MPDKISLALAMYSDEAAEQKQEKKTCPLLLYSFKAFLINLKRQNYLQPRAKKGSADLLICNEASVGIKKIFDTRLGLVWFEK